MNNMEEQGARLKDLLPNMLSTLLEKPEPLQVIQFICYPAFQGMVLGMLASKGEGKITYTEGEVVVQEHM